MKAVAIACRFGAAISLFGLASLPLPANPNMSVDLLCNTFSICAIDPDTGESGVAVTTRLPDVGRLCPFAKAGVGAIATQSYVVVRYGPDGLALLEQGLAPEEVLTELLKSDPQREQRQLGIIDSKGRTATFTGTGCNPYAGHRAGKNYTVQGNLLVGKETIDATADAFEATEGAGMELADRLIAALEAGQASGGDKRKGNKQSAALVVANPRRKHADGSNISVNMQVSEHPEPVGELRRQYDTIRQRLGFRTFQFLEGNDVVQLKQGLHELGFLRKDHDDDSFRAYVRSAAGRQYDSESADAVDAFRKRHGLPCPADRLGYARGIVDEEFIGLFKAAVAKIRKEASEHKPTEPAKD